jgi:formylglycine-generating enzyme required for sulfatase activity
LRIQGEANCATVERLDRYLRYQVPDLNARYRKLTQNPYLQADPPYKINFILLEQTATLRDVEPLKYQASQAEIEGNFSLARQLWVRVLAASGGDLDAVNAIERIALRQRGNDQPRNPTSDNIGSSSAGRSPNSEPAQKSFVQRQKEHQENLVRYEQAFSKAINREYPLSQATRSELNELQQSWQISNDEREQIEQPILAKKDAENRKRQQEEAERLKPQEAQRRRQQQAVTTNSTTTTVITRQKFLKWAGFVVGAGLVAAVVREIFMRISFPSLQSFKFHVVTVDERGKEINRRPSQAKNFAEYFGNSITLNMVSIPAGSFKMGSPLGEKGRTKAEERQHTVNVPTFFLGKFEVTQEQYQQVMGRNPSKFKGAKRPVEQVSWNDAVEFCKKLSQKTGRKYRLPSEAEWEYAARAGTTTPFHFGETITSELANYNGNNTYASEPKGKRRGETTEVGSFSPNSFGLYDMHGNVWEWCQDSWHNSYEGAPSDGSAWINNDNQSRLVRGGSWNDNPEVCRSAYRYPFDAGGQLNVSLGFRVACSGPWTL